AAAPAPAAGAGPPAIALTMSATGTYGQLMAFMRGLDTLPRAIVVDRLALTGTGQLTASIDARMFYAGQPTP
ncbi:MAG: hypothetical protein ACYC1D_04275, partial [Acidimicrobiales bacterium]